jgi:putative transposase
MKKPYQIESQRAVKQFEVMAAEGNPVVQMVLPLAEMIAKKDQQQLRSLLKGGVQQVRVVLCALALLQLASDTSAPQIATVIPLTPQAIWRLGHRYQQAGLDGALYEKQRPGTAEVLDTDQKQRIITIVCSDPPPGQARWTL